jgi:hypothetical protein
MPVRNTPNRTITTRRLSEEEIKDPYLVINSFFDYASLDTAREYLWEWFKTTVSGTYNTKLLTRHRRYDTIYLYEHIEKLIEAAHLINLRQSALKKRNKKGQTTEE